MRLLVAILLLVCCQSVLLGADMKIAILRDGFPVRPCFSEPHKLAGVLTSSGADVEFVDSDALADPKAFNAGRYWLVVLPYGPYFPARARENFLAYLRGGGSFLSTGGYAFDEPVIKWKGQWLTKDQVVVSIPTREVKIGSEGDRDYLTGEWNGAENARGEWNDPDSTKRWSGKSAGLRLGVDPAKHYTLELRVSVNEWAARSHWRLIVNGKPFADIPAGPGQTLTFKLGPEQFNGKTELDIAFDGKLWRPSDVADSPDTRLLGIAVGRVRLISDGPVEQGPDLSILDKPINMRHGKPNDFLETEPEQLGVFDAGYRLAGGKTILPAADQNVTGFSLKGSIEGWAAAGTTGQNWYWTPENHRSRLIPLLSTQDAFGRFRGNAGALMVNNLGLYKGSVWAYFGVESRDLFSAPFGENALLSVVQAMRRGVFLHDLHPSVACYHQGEEAVIHGSVSNFGRPLPKVVRVGVGSATEGGSVRCAVKIDITDESGSPVESDTLHIDIAPGETKEISAKWHPGVYGDDFYEVKADLLIDGKPVDTLRTAFYVWNEQTVANGMRLSYSGNYLRDNGKPRFMLGVEAFYDKSCPAGMDPLDVERDFRDMADMGIHIARTFAYSNESETDRRFVDALVMASQRHHVDFWLSGTVTMGGYLNDPSNISIAQAIGDRYRGVHGMMIDLYNEPDFHAGDDASRDARFNDYLRAKYHSTEALRVAWGDELGKDEQLGSIKMGWIGNDWTSIRSRDVYRFLLQQGGKWVTDVTQAIKSKDLSRLVSCGYLQWWNSMMMDPMATSDSLDFLDRHWYGKVWDIREFDAQFAMGDRRYCGKAPSTGEFGSKTYPTFKETGHNYDTVEQQELRYLHIGHYALALGGAFASNWIYRDPQGSIFPYGIVYSDRTPKPVAKVYRAMSLLFSTMRPKYVEPEVYLVLPDESRFGGGVERIVKASMRAANGLIDARLRFGTIGEWDLAKLPKSARLLILPAPFALSNAGYDHLKTFVENGGVLYVSGDISYDENRKRTKTSRLEELAGVRFVKERYANVQSDSVPTSWLRYLSGIAYPGRPCMEFQPLEAKVIARAGNRPVAVLHSLGRGKVLFSSDPAEFEEEAPVDLIYVLAAQEAGISNERAVSATRGIHIARIPCENGEAAMIGNAGDKAVRVTVKVGGHDYTLSVGANRQAMLVTVGGKLVGLEAQGDVLRGGVKLVSARHHFFAVSLDGRDLADSREIAFTALAVGKYSIGRSDLTAESGEVHGGRWQPLKPLANPISVSTDLVGDVILLSAKDAAARARESVAGLLAE